MKEDVVAANLQICAKVSTSLKSVLKKKNTTISKSEQSVKVDFDKKTIYNGVAKSFCACWNEALSVVKQHVWKQQPDTLPFRCGSRNSLNYSSRSLNFLNIFIDTFAITISIVWLSRQIPKAY